MSSPARQSPSDLQQSATMRLHFDEGPTHRSTKQMTSQIKSRNRKTPKSSGNRMYSNGDIRMLRMKLRAKTDVAPTKLLRNKCFHYIVTCLCRCLRSDKNKTQLHVLHSLTPEMTGTWTDTLDAWHWQPLADKLHDTFQHFTPTPTLMFDVMYVVNVL